MDQEVPYLLRGQKTVATESSVLVSSSKYLNDADLRDWVSTHFLRRSSKDMPTPSDAYKLYMIVKELYDYDRIEALFTEDRKRFPALDAWLEERFISQYSAQDLVEAYKPGSLGYIYGRYVLDNNFQLDIVPRFDPKSQFEYYNLRSGQTHDLEHLVFGGGFDSLGELIPYYVRLSNVPRFLSPELAGQVNLMQLMGSTRFLMRTGLHYPQAYPTALKAVQQGMKIGEATGPVFLNKYEDVFHLTLPEVREKFGVPFAEDMDTLGASRAWDENR
jgi:ubiquinone biosynthesis protein COQ4